MSLRLRDAVLFVVVITAGCKESIRPDSLATILKDYDYAEIVPPSTLLPPGTVVALRQQNPLSVDIVCTQEGNTGSAAGIVTSTGTTQELRNKTNKTFKLSGDYLGQIKADARFSRVRDVTFTLTNVSVKDLPDSALYDALNKRTAGCRAAIAGRRSRGQSVTMINSVFMGDITYTVQFENNASLSAEAKQELLKGVAAQMGLEVGSSGTNTIKGTQLIWGVRDNSELVDAKRPDHGNTVPKKPVLPAAASVSVSAAVDTR